MLFACKDSNPPDPKLYDVGPWSPTTFTPTHDMVLSHLRREHHHAPPKKWDVLEFGETMVCRPAEWRCLYVRGDLGRASEHRGGQCRRCPGGSRTGRDRKFARTSRVTSSTDRLLNLVAPGERRVVLNSRLIRQSYRSRPTMVPRSQPRRFLKTTHLLTHFMLHHGHRRHQVFRLH